MILHCEFTVRVAIAEQEIREVVASVLAIEVERALGITEQVLDFLIEGPASSNFELMRALGPGDVVAYLIIVCLVVPRPTGDVIIRSCGTRQVNAWNASKVIACEQLWNAQPAGPGDSTGGNDIDAIAIVVE